MLTWLLYAAWAAFLIPLLAQAAPGLRAAMNTPAAENASMADIGWQAVRYILSVIVGLLIYVFKRERDSMDKRINELATQVQAMPDALEERINQLEASIQMRERAAGALNATHHDENRRRLERIENKMDRAMESVPAIIRGAQADLYRRVGKLEGEE